MAEEHPMHITHLRDSLGWAWQEVVRTDEPIVVLRYNRPDVMLVPAWEWRFLKQIEADIQAGRCPWEKNRQTGKESGQSGAVMA